MLNSKENWRKTISVTQKLSKKYKKIVIWGLRHSNDSFTYINNHFYTTLQKLNIPSVWLDDSRKSNSLINDDDLVFAANVAAKNLEIKPGRYYCLHNFDASLFSNLDLKKILILQVYSDDVRKRKVKFWDPVTCFEKESRTLYQPWGTNLLPWEFMEPVFSKNSPFVFWVGSIWDNDQHQGNLEAINELKKAIYKYNLKFMHVRVPDFLSTKLVRASRLAPAVAGMWQAKVNYLPCRMFKNISYGQLGITNVTRFLDLLKDSYIPGKSITELIDVSMTLSKEKYLEMVKNQQEIISYQTYLQKVLNIFKGLEEIA